MKQFRKSWSTGVNAFMVAGAVLVTHSAFAQEKTKISFAHFGTLANPVLTLTVVPLRDALEATGKVEVTMYGTGSAYSVPSKYSEMVAEGVIDMAFGGQQFEGGRFPLNVLMGEPFLINDHVKGSRAVTKLARNQPELAAEFRPNRLVLVTLASGEQLHGRKPIKSIDDLKGMRVMTTNPGLQAIVREVGGSVVALPLTAQYENLQKGVVDFISGSWQSLIAFKTMEISSHHLHWDPVMTPVYLVINQKKYDSLPAEAKKVIDDHTTEDTAVRWSSMWTKIDAIAIAEARKNNHSLIDTTPETREALKKRFRHVTDTRVADLEKKGLPARKVFDAILKTVAEEERAK
ncbi:MAG: TRAP transporter substrate-binding protein DctP [Burkholderiales bacterium]